MLGDFSYVDRMALITTLEMAAGTLGAGGIALFRTGKVDTLYVANGLLAGLVGITGIADAITWPGGIVVGLLAGIQLPLVFEFVENRLKFDDVCAVFPVHGSAGVLGILTFSFVSTEGFTVDALAAQMLGVLVITIWTVVATHLVFTIAKILGQARVTPKHERDGLDVSEHGIDTYPEFGGQIQSRMEVHSERTAVCRTTAVLNWSPPSYAQTNSVKQRRRCLKLAPQVSQ
ncbi:hypothetical protein GCM10025751_52000 [Haladaptatus pallidirubidus]|uniref:Ammonium transporter AmtB-like domain-containing protein n=1 Tax=Haladaptatus pallidirubidus TaxID=1008152 RepID=A0AAV3UQJ1_9EURY